MGISVAIKAFFAALTNKEKSARIANALRDSGSPQIESLLIENKDFENQDNLTKSSSARQNVDLGRSDALELLAMLQREARFIDFIKESLVNCDDAAVGAAARTVHDRCSNVIERCFEVRSLTDVQEGESLTLSGDEAKNGTRVQLVGGTEGASGVSGQVVHAGWIAKKCSTPKWSGSKEDELVLSPIVIEN